MGRRLNDLQPLRSLTGAWTEEIVSTAPGLATLFRTGFPLYLRAEAGKDLPPLLLQHRLQLRSGNALQYSWQTLAC